MLKQKKYIEGKTILSTSLDATLDENTKDATNSTNTKLPLDISSILRNKLFLIYGDSSGLIVDPSNMEAIPYVVLGPIDLPVTLHGETIHFLWYTFARYPSGHKIMTQEEISSSPESLLKIMSTELDLANSALVLGNIDTAESPLVRVHSCCATGDIFGSQRCECGPQLRRSQQMIVDEGTGIVLYLSDHEGRGIGLFSKAATYLLQDAGFDTYEANRKLGFPDDCRKFAEASLMINFLRGNKKTIRLISNNPDKKNALEQSGIVVQKMMPLVSGLTKYNRKYIETKREGGHTFSEELFFKWQPKITHFEDTNRNKSFIES